jgi:hypothetical protein
MPNNPKTIERLAREVDPWQWHPYHDTAEKSDVGARMLEAQRDIARDAVRMGGRVVLSEALERLAGLPDGATAVDAAVILTALRGEVAPE